MKKLLLVGTLMCALSNAAYAQSDEVKTLINQEETLNTINVPSNSTILPERMFVDDPKDNYNYPKLYIDYP
ncbi:hypothetical protein, partial [Commensalibacter sp. Nvir]|uniref:hypothetical protein n=1 Tax=Commensalibacter sp. Nvir TaxID=3069817 RepID=UPI0030C7F3D4